MPDLGDEHSEDVEITLSDWLWDHGWRQGAIVNLKSSHHVSSSRDETGNWTTVTSELPAFSHGKYIVATQDCDLVASSEVEPFLELVLCTEDSDGAYASRIRNGTRWFGIPGSNLVVHSAFRLTILKRDLMGIDSIESYLDSESRVQFREWLSKRVSRPALPDVIYNAIVSPLRQVIERNKDRQYMKTFDRKVDEIRISLPLESHPPFGFRLLLIVNDGISEEQNEQFDKALNKIESKFSSHEGADLVAIDVRLPGEISLSDYRMTVFVDFDAISNRGSNP